MSPSIIGQPRGELNDFDLEGAFGSDLWEVDLECKFDLPPTPPTAYMISPLPSPKWLPAVKDEKPGSDGSGSTTAGFIWSQALALEAFDDIPDFPLGIDTSGLCGILTPPRSPCSTEGKENLQGFELDHASICELELLEESEGEMANIDPAKLQTLQSPQSLFSGRGLQTLHVSEGEEEGEVDVETVDEHQLSGSQLLCFKQQLLQQQPFQQTTGPAMGLLTGLGAPFESAPAGLHSATGVPSNIFAPEFSTHPCKYEEPKALGTLRYSPYSRPQGKCDPDYKRHTHNLLEKRRREDLKSTFEVLSRVVPEAAADSKCSRLQILQGATDQIRKLHELGHKAATLRDSVHADNDLLTQRLFHLRSSLQVQGIAPCV